MGLRRPSSMHGHLNCAFFRILIDSSAGALLSSHSQLAPASAPPPQISLWGCLRAIRVPHYGRLGHGGTAHLERSRPRSRRRPCRRPCSGSRRAASQTSSGRSRPWS
eukprot:scaffold1620_cov233-Pinguiococcus_pyrenoidosus.AAC.18